MVEVPVVQTVEVEKFVHETVQAPICADIACEARENIIRAECLLSAPVAAHRAEFEEKINEHRTRYPGGMLPNELCNFEDYMGRVRHRLDTADHGLVQ